jgi:Streptomycin adenylyltransferase
MDIRLPASIDRLRRHKERLIAACETGWGEPDILGMAIAGSFVDGTPDEYSDLDLRIVLRDRSLESVFSRREELARNCGPLVAGFTGEHVGEPHLFITLYEDLLHVDFLFMELAEAPERNDGRQVVVLWERDREVAAALSRPYAPNPEEQLSYVESRFWTWTWYIQSKILRGEIWEAVSALNFVRDAVLFRLLAMRRGIRFRGARHASDLLGDYAMSLERTQASLGKRALLDALTTTVRLYLELADPLLAEHSIHPDAARPFVLRALAAGLSWRPLA